MKKVRIKPIKDVIVRDKINKEIVPKEGVDVVLNSYWRRRINDGSMYIVDNKKDDSKDDKSNEEKTKKNDSFSAHGNVNANKNKTIRNE